MATFVLIPGAGSDARYWSRVVPEIEAAGHRAVAPDLPIASDEATFETYADSVLAALHDGRADVVVAQSMGAFCAPMVATRCGARRIVLVAPMIPRPGETAGDWWDGAGQPAAQAELAAAEAFDPEFDPYRIFLHDVPPDVVAEIEAAGPPDMSDAIFSCPFPLDAWPAIATTVVAGAHDRLFPLPMVRRLARERLGVEPEVIDTGHLPAFARPAELTSLLLASRD